MGNGKRGNAPCGHSGEAVIGQYYRCLEGCDEEIELGWEDITPTMTRCSCGSYNIEDFELDALYYMFNPGSTIIVDSRCIDCGKCWLSEP